MELKTFLPRKTIRTSALSLFSCAGLYTPVVGAAEQLEWAASGQLRTRYELQDGQFRAAGQGIDNLLLFQSFVKLTARHKKVVLNFEVQDSRSYFSQEHEQLSSSLVNPLDILQFNLEAQLDDVLATGSKSSLRLGRQTIKFSSSRQLSRPGYANVAWGFTGAYLETTFLSGAKLHAFAVVPVERQPTDQEALHDNSLNFDSEEWHKKLWAVHYISPKFSLGNVEGIVAETYAYGFHEEDTNIHETANRQYINPGFRLLKKQAPASWDFDLEATYRFGSRYETSSPLDRNKLNVKAGFLFARAGYTVPGRWNFRVAGQVYWVSGDRDPADGTYGQYDRLYSARRTDLNNTSIYGPLSPVNLSAVGVRFEVKPSPKFDARLTYSHASLASGRGAWGQGKLHDPTGQSGSFIGHAFDSRFRFHQMEGRLTIDFGASLLLHGEFTKTAPGASSDTRSLYGYGQVEWRF